MSLRVIRCKPNPAGKDRSRYSGATAAQLGAEWVDVQNAGSVDYPLDRVKLFHLAFSAGKSEWALVTGFTGSLPAGKIVRVHSGQVRDLSVLHPQDLVCADFNIFTGRDAYVWNNAEGDTAGLWETRSESWIDKAGYDPYPPEGVVLVRQGDRLVAGRSAFVG